MHPLLVVLAVVALALPTDAEACSCRERSFAEHVKAAKHVYLARAGTPTRTGDALAQPFQVLATLKGTATTQFRLSRPATPPCAANYAENEVAILFTQGGDLDPCLGNIPLASQIGVLAAILDATGTKRGAAKAATIEAALRAALAGYTHDRPQIAVRHETATGSFQIGTSKLVFTTKRSKDEVLVAKAFATDSIALVTGTYEREGLRFTVLLYLDRAWTVAWASVAER